MKGYTPAQLIPVNQHRGRFLVKAHGTTAWERVQIIALCAMAGSMVVFSALSLIALLGGWQ